VIRRLATLVAVVLILPHVLVAQEGRSAATGARNSGKEHLRRDEYGMAIKSFSTFVALAPGDNLGYDLRACAYLRTDSVDLALKDIAKSQQLEGDEEAGYFANWLNGIALLLRADTAGADAALAKAAAGSPSVAKPRIARARQYADSLFGDEEDSEQLNELRRRKLAVLLLDECVDYQLFGAK
jgi:Flp pilus assembly protein TadD